MKRFRWEVVSREGNEMMSFKLKKVEWEGGKTDEKLVEY